MHAYYILEAQRLIRLLNLLINQKSKTKLAMVVLVLTDARNSNTLGTEAEGLL